VDTWKNGNFSDADDDWHCPDDCDLPLATNILRRMGFRDAEIDASRRDWRRCGWLCDCELLLFEARQKKQRAKQGALELRRELEANELTYVDDDDFGEPAERGYKLIPDGYWEGLEGNPDFSDLMIWALTERQATRIRDWFASYCSEQWHDGDWAVLVYDLLTVTAESFVSELAEWRDDPPAKTRVH
jgi:hypothetical protein